MQRADSHSPNSLSALNERGLDGVRLASDESLARHTSLRIGGTASYWAEAGSVAGLRALVKEASSQKLPVFVVGLGSNVLFPDEGIDGVVVRLTGELAEWDVASEEDASATVSVGGGVVNAHLVRGLLSDGWVGAEFLRLIPGTFGGAVALNAGTKERELSAILQDVSLLERDGQGGWNEVNRSAEELELGYRHCELPDDSIVLSGRITVERGDVEEARQAMEADRQRRDETQPYKLASVGSTFANPDGDYAGRLIDEVGLKGERIGGARISETHANFFINEDDATAEDFLRLMALARVRVRQTFDVELRPEVRFVGFDGLERMSEYERELC